MAEFNSTQDHPSPLAGQPGSGVPVEEVVVVVMEEFKQPAEDMPGPSDPMSKAGEWIESNARVAQRSANEWFHRAQVLSTYAFEEVSERVRVSVEQTGKKIRNAANDDPIRFVGIVAGSAFAAGVLLRMWRSNRYE